MRVRLAVWGAVGLAVFQLTFVPAITSQRALHSVLSLALLLAFLMLSLDPPVRSALQRRLMWVALGLSVVSFLLVQLSDEPGIRSLARILAVGVVAALLWLAAREERWAFPIAAAIVGAAGWVPMDADLLLYLGFGLSAATAAAVAWRLSRTGAPATGRMGGGYVPKPLFGPPARRRKPAPRQVVVSNLVTLTPEQKAERLAALERRFQAGEIPEHVYWDRRQEIESR